MTSKNTNISFPFKTFIDDICTKKIKKVNFEKVKKMAKEQKERAYTFSHNVDVDVPAENWRMNNRRFDNARNNPIPEFTRKINVNNI